MTDEANSTTSSNPLYSTNELASLIPEYDGNQTLLNNFLNACEEAQALASEQQKKLILIHIKNKLRGRASNLINSRHITEFGDIATLLKAHFGDSRDITSLIHDLQLLKQLPNEKASSFAHRVQALSDQVRGVILLQPKETAAQKQAQSDLIDKITLDVLITGLEPKIGTVIRASNPNSIVTASQRIVREEQLFYYEKSKIQEKYYPSNNKRPPQNNYAHNNKPFSQNANNNSHHNNTNLQFCRYCKKPGHTLEVCRKRQYNNSSHNSQNQRTTFNNNNSNQGHYNNQNPPNFNNQNNNFNRHNNNAANIARRQVNHLNSNGSQALGNLTHSAGEPNATEISQMTQLTDEFSQLQF